MLNQRINVSVNWITHPIFGVGLNSAENKIVRLHCRAQSKPCSSKFCLQFITNICSNSVEAGTKSAQNGADLVQHGAKMGSIRDPVKLCDHTAKLDPNICSNLVEAGTKRQSNKGYNPHNAKTNDQHTIQIQSKATHKATTQSKDNHTVER